MSGPDRVSSRPPQSPEGGRQSQCSTCHGSVDPLRAFRVRIIDDRFCYFCSASCADDYEPGRAQSEPRPAVSAAAEPVVGASEIQETPPYERTSQPPDALPARDAERLSAVEPVEAYETTPVSPTAAVRTQVDVSRRNSVHTPLTTGLTASAGVGSAGQGPAFAIERERAARERTRLLVVAMTTAGLSLLLLLALEGAVTSWLRIALLDASFACLVTYALKSRQAEGRFDLSTLVSLVLAAAELIFAHAGVALELATSTGWLGLAGTHLGYLAFVLFTLDRKFVPLDDARLEIQQALDGSVLRLNGSETTRIAVSELRPGEEIVIHAGEVLPVDASIVAGSAEVHPWLGTDRVREVGPDDFVYAGTRLTSGQLRAVVRWNGNDRHWMRLTHDTNRMAHLRAPSVISARKWATHVVPVLIAIAALITWFQEPGLAFQYALATAAVLLSPAGIRLIQAEVLNVVLSALKNGIVIANAQAIEAASKVSAAVFCARGTLLLGEPELSFLHPMGQIDSDTLLALAAGAEQVSPHPIANSVLRAARAQNIVPDAVRNPRAEPGLGVTALTSGGRTLIVGSRALMLRERISVARAEQRITELEATGRTVLLVAVDGHLAGTLAFQDGLRAGARASIQHLLDAGIEPILLSGDARETCEALAKTIDVEHVRPDVLPQERGKEIERLRGGGGVIAVVGRSPTDDLALSAASVSIALPGRGSQAGGFDIELASDEVQNAALALNLLTRHRRLVQRIQTLLLGGSVLLVFAAVALAIPAGFLPLGALLLFVLMRTQNAGAARFPSSRTK